MAISSFGQAIPVLGQNVGFPGTVSRMGSKRTIVARQVLPTTPSNLVFGLPAILIPDAYGGTFQPVPDFIAGNNQTTTTGNTTNGNNQVPVASIAGISVGQTVTGNGIAANTTVAAVSDLSGIPTVTLNANANGNNSNSTLTFVNSISASIGLIYSGAGIPGGPNQGPRYAGIAVREVQTQLSLPTTPNANTTLAVGSYAPGAEAEVLEEGSCPVQITNGTPQAGMPVYMRVLANNAIAGTSVGDLEAAADVVVSPTATLVAGNTTITVSANTSIAAGQIVSGGSIPTGTCVVSVSGNNVVLSQAPTAAGAAGTPVSFANTLPLPECVFRTGYMDANGVAEITLTNRRAA